MITASATINDIPNLHASIFDCELRNGATQIGFARDARGGSTLSLTMTGSAAVLAGGQKLAYCAALLLKPAPWVPLSCMAVW